MVKQVAGSTQASIGTDAIRINLLTAVRRRTVILSAMKHLGPANEILRLAQDDNSEGSFLRLAHIVASIGIACEQSIGIV